MMSLANYTVIKAWLLSLLLMLGAVAHAAQVAGTVTDLNGPLLAKKPDGTVKILSQKSLVEQGDLLVTEKDTYARIRFLDNSEVTLRPGTHFKIDHFAFAEDKPQDDGAVFSLLKGGLRAVTGVVGKRNRERTSLNTPAATIGIRGTIYIAEYIPPELSGVAAYGRASLAHAGIAMAADAPGSRSDIGHGPVMPDILPAKDTVLAQAPVTVSEGRAPGLYVQVLEGMINVSNSGGALQFTAGQFGYTPSVNLPPVILPANPGMQFTPPPAMSSAVGTTGGAASSSSGTGTVNCEVR